MAANSTNGNVHCINLTKKDWIIAWSLVACVTAAHICYSSEILNLLDFIFMACFRLFSYYCNKVGFIFIADKSLML